MFTLTEENTLQAPVYEWGVKAEKLTLASFTPSIISAVIGFIGVWLTISPFAETLQMFGKTFAVTETGKLVACLFLAAAACWALYLPSLPAKNAGFEADQRSRKWQKDHLIPYLERKYGIEIMGNVFGFCYPYASKDGKIFKFKVCGVDNSFDSFGGGFENSYQNFRITDKTNGPTIEQVVLPTESKVTFLPMEPVS